MIRKKLLGLCLLVSFVSCGQAGSLGLEGELAGDEFTNNQLSPTENPFDSFELGDNYAWGQFIRGAYQTTQVTELPLPVYTAYFTPDEVDIIQDAIDMANAAVGFQVFELVDDWSPDVRIIYKVKQIAFDDEGYAAEDFKNVVGYTFSRNVYIHGLKEAGRVVTDWAMEIRADHVNKWVIAHELGHAMGIQKHALINYDEDRLENLSPNSLMSETIGFKPELEDYEFMMNQQGEILLEYMDLLGVH